MTVNDGVLKIKRLFYTFFFLYEIITKKLLTNKKNICITFSFIINVYIFFNPYLIVVSYLELVI